MHVDAGDVHLSELILNSSHFIIQINELTILEMADIKGMIDGGADL